MSEIGNCRACNKQLKLTKHIFPCLICALALLSGCTKEPTMFEKCFVAEQKKLEGLPDEALFAQFGYSPKLHSLFQELSVQDRALDEVLLENFEQKRRVEWARATQLQSQNPLYQKYKTLYDDHREYECCGEEWSDTFLAYREAEKACEADPMCHIYVLDYPDIAALNEANPENRLWEVFGDDVNRLMESRDWSSILGEGHEPEKYMEKNFLYHLTAAYAELDPGDEIALSEMSPIAAVRARRAIQFKWQDHWLSVFDAKKKSVFDQFAGIARETCNTRGLYE